MHAVMVAPDQRGLMSKAAAVLALNSLRVHSASVNVHEGVAIAEFVVSPLFGSPPDAGPAAPAVRRCAERRRRRPRHAREAGQRRRQLGDGAGRRDSGGGAADAFDRPAPHPVARYRRARPACRRSPRDGPGRVARHCWPGRWSVREQTSPGRRSIRSDRRRPTCSVWQCRLSRTGTTNRARAASRSTCWRCWVPPRTRWCDEPVGD